MPLSARSKVAPGHSQTKSFQYQKRSEDRKGDSKAQYGTLNGKEDEEPNVCRGAFSVACTTCKEPENIMGEMHRALDFHKVQARQVSF